MLLTRDLDRTIRLAEIAGIENAIEAAARLSPQTVVTSIEVAGGLVAFTGVDSPLSQAYGLGAEGTVTPAEISVITAFYESRGATARVFVSATADPSLARGLAKDGYVPTEYENVLALDATECRLERDERVRVARDLDAWTRASAAGFLEGQAAGADDLLLARIIGTSRGAVPLEIREDGAIVSTGAMDEKRDCAALFAGSTLAAFRGRGYHRALIKERIARARGGGARLLRATAKPGSVSERNLHRCGFETLYTRVLWERTG